MMINYSRSTNYTYWVQAAVGLLVVCVVLGGAGRARKDSLPAGQGADDGCVIVVRPSNTGQAVIGPTVNGAHSGCTIRLRKGTYKEIITITKSVSLIGEEGATLDPSEALSAKWEA